jgi:hypothetical protein
MALNQENEQRYTVEYMWKLYLTRCGITENKLPYTQRTEMKKTFFGAIGIWLRILAGDNSEELTEEEMLTVMDRIEEEVSTFFKNEVKRFNNPEDDGQG